MYILEGNIGAGKSTFLTLLERHLPSVSIGYEPVSDWQAQVAGESLLTNFYQDPKRWAYAMEMYTMFTRVREHLKDQAYTEKIRIVERSLYSGHYCFAQNDYDSGFLTPLEWYMYCAWFDFLVVGKCRPPQGFIYLRVSPKIAYERTMKRKRTGEAAIPLEYLENLHRYHERFLIEKKDILAELVSVPVLVLEVNEDFETNNAVFEQLLKKVTLFIGVTE